MREQFVMHLPKHALRVGCLCRFSGVQDVQISARQRELAKGEAQVVAEPLLDVTDDEVHLIT